MSHRFSLDFAHQIRLHHSIMFCKPCSGCDEVESVGAVEISPVLHSHFPWADY